MAINYNKVGWDTTKYINPSNMNHMDEGIKAACDKADANEKAIEETNSNLANQNNVIVSTNWGGAGGMLSYNKQDKTVSVSVLISGELPNTTTLDADTVWLPSDMRPNSRRAIHGFGNYNGQLYPTTMTFETDNTIKVFHSINVTFTDCVFNGTAYVGQL